jgi:hypothetical protein
MKTLVLDESGDFKDLAHLFHFVELLYVAFVKLNESGTPLSDIRMIKFPNWRLPSWRGKFNDHNKWLLTKFFPGAAIVPGGRYKLGDPDVIVVDRAECDHGKVNKTIIKYMQRFNPYDWAKVIGPIDFRNSKPVVTYISRQNTRRQLPPLVHHKLIEALNSISDINLRVVEMETFTFEQQVELARQTDVLVGVHGNGLTHTAFMRPNKFVCEIFTPGVTFHWDYYTLSKSMSHEYICIFDGRQEMPGHFIDNNFVPCMQNPINFRPLYNLIQTAKTEIIRS